MNQEHLTPQKWRTLLDRTHRHEIAGEAWSHLLEGCETCDALLSNLREADGLDASIDAAVADIGMPPGVGDAEWLSQIERRVVRAGNRAAPRLKSDRRRVAMLVAAAAVSMVVLAVGLASLPPMQTPGQRVKGIPAVVPSLSLLVLDKAENGVARMAPIDHSMAYLPSTQVFFSYDLPDPAHVAIARLGLDQTVELIFPNPGASSSREPAGHHTLTIDGVVQAYALSGLVGRQRFALITSARPLSEDEVRRAIAEGSGFGVAFADIVVSGASR